MTLLVSHIIVEKFWPTPFTTMLRFIELYRHLLMHGSLQVPLQHKNQVKVWTLTESLQHLVSFLFQPFGCIFALIFGIIVLLYDLCCPLLFREKGFLLVTQLCCHEF